MNPQFDETTLSAYVDGELDVDTMREVEASLEHDGNGRCYVQNAIRTTALLRASMNKALHEEIPSNLITFIKDDGSILRNKKPSWHLFFRLAATILLILTGFGIGSLYNRYNTDQPPFLTEPLPARYSQLLDEALEYKLSGSSLSWHSPEEPVQIIITPVKTYRDKMGRYYREFNMALLSEDEQAQFSGLAYRTDKGKWKTTALFY